MARPKIARKSTSVDMTAMCDVAFLLLSFFILTAKPKASANINVETPSSVSSKVAPEKDVTLISITKDGKVFLSVDNMDVKQSIADQLNSAKGLALTPGEVTEFKNASFYGAPFSQLKSSLKLPADQVSDKYLPGIPITDTLHNELIEWMKYVVQAHASTGTKLNILLKGDNLAKYPGFKNIITALKKNDQFKFQMITNAEGVPEGTDLWKKFMRGETTTTAE